jgi:L-aspartate oxidase
MLAEETDCQYLDLRHLPAQRMHERFPTISAICRSYGLDLATDLLPVAPAAHYCMGGVKVDTLGRTTVDGLYAVGEVSCTGVHGANRLASNSLLEGLVFGLRLADEIRDASSEGMLPGRRSTTSVLSKIEMEFNRPRATTRVPSPTGTNIRSELRHIMWKYVSLRRDSEGLIEARRQVDALRKSMVSRQEEEKMLPERLETENMLTVAGLVIETALQRCESRGSHWRIDFPETDEALAGYHYVLQATRVRSDEIAGDGHRGLLTNAMPGAPLKEMAYHASTTFR